MEEWVDPQEKRKLMITFQVELEGYLVILSKGLLALEEGPPQEERKLLLAELSRTAHSIKGTARTLDLWDIETIAHRLEDVLSAFQRRELSPTSELLDALFPVIDVLQEAMAAHLRGESLPPQQRSQLLARLEAALQSDVVIGRHGDMETQGQDDTEPEPETSLEPEPEPEALEVSEASRSLEPAAEAPPSLSPSPRPRVSVSPSEEIIRVATAKLDDLMDGMGELLVTRMRTEQRLTELREIQQWLARWQKSWRRVRGHYKRLQRKDGPFDYAQGRPFDYAQGRPFVPSTFPSTTLRYACRYSGQGSGRRLGADLAPLDYALRPAQGGAWDRQDSPGPYGALRQPFDTPAATQDKAQDMALRQAQDMAALLGFLAYSEEYLDTLSTRVDNLLRRFTTDYGRLILVSDDLQDSVRQVRMLPIANLFDVFPRMVRNLARERGKEVTLRVEGADTEVDRHVLEMMKDPLTHLLRNAVDHGIESPDQREAAGKPRRGTIYLRAARKGNTIVIEVADDGTGIDPKAVRQAAVERGLLTAQEVANLSDRDTMQLIFRSGLSTRRRVTDLSGRGVGLDVVRENLDRLHGLVEVDTVPGRFTIFTLTLPLTMATSHVLLVEVAGQTVAMPTMTVDCILYVDAADVGSIEGKPTIRTDERPLPLISLAQVLELPQADAPLSPGQKIPVVVLSVLEKRIAFRVDGFRGAQEVIIKSLGRQLSRVRNVAGATILGSGEVVVILNVADLMQSAQVGRATAAPLPIVPREAHRRRVLVVDDSITTRTLEKNILESAGYEVLVAADGEEAWALVQSEPLDAIAADIAMPHMDGFTLTEKVKGDERFKELPVVLVTSLESPQDKIRGLEAGADAYITKRSFDQLELLQTIEQLIG